jgi:arylsulfatase A-like enzyme
MLEVATFAPHTPYTPAVEDRNSFPNLQAPHTPAWNTIPANAPSWLAGKPRLGEKAITQLGASFRKRVRAVQSVDRMIGHLTGTLRRTGQLSNTVFVFSSDNGFHMGEYRLHAGKMSAFDTDVNVPLIVTGPGIRAGQVNDALVQNIDLAPTFEQLAGLTPDPNRDGTSFLGLLQGTSAASWRTLALVEHHGADDTNYENDPDWQPVTGGDIPSYYALRSAQFTYVHYRNGEREYYDRSVDKYELHNSVDQLSAEQINRLDAWMAALTSCQGVTQCWAAGQEGQL